MDTSVREYEFFSQFCLMDLSVQIEGGSDNEVLIAIILSVPASTGE